MATDKEMDALWIVVKSEDKQDRNGKQLLRPCIVYVYDATIQAKQSFCTSSLSACFPKWEMLPSEETFRI